MRRDDKYIAKHAELAKELERPAPVRAEKSPTRFSRSAKSRPPLKGEAKAKRRVVAAVYRLPKNYVSAEQLRAEFQRALGLEVATQPEKPEPEIRNYWND